MTRVAVVGVGSMGRNHIRVFREMLEVNLVALVDQDKGIAESANKRYCIPTYQDYIEMAEKERPDAVSIVVPTKNHYPVAKSLLELGCHVLVEKPICATIEEAKNLIKIANKVGKILMVGHIERYNPAIMELKKQIDNGNLGKLFQVHSRRIGPFPGRVLDVGVAMDLGTHEIDIMRYLTGSEVTRVYAESRQELHQYHEDLVDGILCFDNGIIGLLEVNWLTPTKIRELYATGERGMFRVDYLTQDLYFYENASQEENGWSNLSLFRGVTEGSMTKLRIIKKEPLRAELEAFVAAVEGKDSRIVDGYDGIYSLEIAQAIIESSQNGILIHINPQ